MYNNYENRLSRRSLLGVTGALFGWSFIPGFAYAAGARDSRFVCIVLRGALDGLSTVAPIGDPNYVKLRERIALTKEGPESALPLDGFFALHPAMPVLAELYKAKQALIVHAVATGYRDRSHFDGQDVLESGQPAPGRADSGWLNRLLLALPKGDRVAPHGALGVGPVAPLVVRGQAPVLGWAPQIIPRANEDLSSRLLDLYGNQDSVLRTALVHGLEADGLAAGQMIEVGKGGRGLLAMQRTAEGAARLMAAPEGPRIAALAFGGWDTHANEGGATGRLADLLGNLDHALGAFQAVLREKWQDTVIMVVTEFGRTAHVNGTIGTDHGTGTVAILVGGAVRGGRVVADWPGLTPAALHDGRDLKPTSDLRGVMKGVLADLFGVSTLALGQDIFPSSNMISPMKGLIV